MIFLTEQKTKRRHYLYEAQTFVKKIEEALQSKMIEISIDERYLQNFDGTTEIIL